jgi:hypothetical protein
MFQTKDVEKIKTHILLSVASHSSEYRAVHEIMLKSIIEAGRPQMTI